MMQDDQYDDKRLMWVKDNIGPEHMMHSNHQMHPYDMGQRHHQLAITDLSNNMLDGKLGSDMEHMHMAEMGKKKRGRPKKVRGEGEEVVKKPTVKRPKPQVPPDFNGEIPQKKRGRPKKGPSDGAEMSPRPPKTPQPYNGNDAQKKKRGRPKKSKGDKDDNGMLPPNEMSQGAVNDTRASNEYMASMYSQTAPVNSCSSLPPHQSLRPYDQQSGSKGFNIGGNYFGIGGSPNTQLNNSSGNYSQQNYHSQHQYTHSDLSSDLSAAITADHLANADDVNSPASASPNLGPTNFEQSSGMLSGSSTPPNRMPHQMQQSNSNICYSPYHTPPSNEYMQHNMQQIPGTPTHSRQSSHNDALNDNYLPPQASSQLNSHQIGDSYSQVPGQHPHQQHPYHHQQGPAALQRQQSGSLSDMYSNKMMNTTDVTAKSLSGLESLVDQIPSLSSYSTDTGNASNAIDEHSLNEMRNAMDNPINEISQMSGGAGGNGDEPSQQQSQQQQDSQSQFDSNCIYSTDYSPAGSGGNLGCPMIGGNSPDIGGNNSRSRSSEGAGAGTPNSNMSIAAHQASNANYSPSPMNMRPTSANASPSAHTPPANNTTSYSPFSVSSLTGTGANSYTPTGSPTPSPVAMNSYHSHNLMSAAIQNSLPPGLYMDSPHLPMAVNPLYHHPHHAYSQHPSSYTAGGYGSMAHLQYQQQQQQLAQEQSLSGAGLPTLPTLHMPSPNYPYGYGTNSPAMGYHQQAAAAAAAANHHPSHPAGYLAGHHSMFDRL